MLVRKSKTHAKNTPKKHAKRKGAINPNGARSADSNSLSLMRRWILGKHLAKDGNPNFVGRCAVSLAVSLRFSVGSHKTKILDTADSAGSCSIGDFRQNQREKSGFLEIH